MNIEVNTIHRLEQALSYLMLSVVGPNSLEIKKKIIAINRKLRITRELAETKYIAVAGTQSAGKTRLIREIYNLDKTWLDDNEGRGEQLPIFILENKDCVGPYAVMTIIDKEGKEQEEKIDSEKLKDILKNYNTDSSILLTKLYVPSRHFKSNNFGFVLLPGYEMETRENKEWQELMRHTLTHALGCILVTDKTRIAENSQKRILDDLKSKYLKYRKPIVAATKTENFTEEQRIELRQTIAEVFEFSDKEQENIILTGADNEEYKQRWLGALILAIEYTALSSRESEAAKYTELDEILSDEVDGIVDLVQQKMIEDDVKENNGVAEKSIENILSAFDKARDKFKKKYSKELMNQTQSYINVAVDTAENKYKNEEEGFVNWLKNTGNIMMQNSDTARHKNRIREIWLDNRNPDQTKPKTIIESNFLALSSLSKEQLRLEIKPNFQRNDRELVNNTQDLLGIAKTSSKEISILDKPEVQDGLKLLFNPDLVQSEQQNPKFDVDLPKAIELVPALVMEYARMMQIATVSTVSLDNIQKGMSEHDLIANIAKSTSEGLPKFNESLKPVLKTMAAILAVDVTIDGQIDTIPALISAISGVATAANTATTGTAAATTVGSTASMAAAGIIIAGYLVYQIGKESERYHNSQKEYIAAVLGQYGDANVQKALEQYDDVMENIRDILSNNLYKAYGLDKSMFKNDTILRCLASVKNSQENLQRYLSGQQSRLA